MDELEAESIDIIDEIVVFEVLSHIDDDDEEDDVECVDEVVADELMLELIDDVVLYDNEIIDENDEALMSDDDEEGLDELDAMLLILCDEYDEIEYRVILVEHLLDMLDEVAVENDIIDVKCRQVVDEHRLTVLWIHIVDDELDEDEIEAVLDIVIDNDEIEYLY